MSTKQKDRTRRLLFGDVRNTAPIIAAEGEEFPSDASAGNQDAIRAELLKKFRAGELTKLRMGISAADSEPNRNSMGVADFPEWCASMVGQPFLYDHEPTMDNVVGSIVAAKAFAGADGKQELHEVVELVAPKAIEAALIGTMKKFSPGWNAEWLECSACQKNVKACKHLPGQTLANGKKVALLSHGSRGAETSAVVFSAWDTGTTGYAIAATLEYRQDDRESGSPERTEEKVKISEKLAKAIGITAGEIEPEALTAAVEKHLEGADGLRTTVGRMALLVELPITASASEVEAALAARVAGKTFVPREEHEKVVAAAKAAEIRTLIDTALKSGQLTAKQAEKEGWAEKYGVDNGVEKLKAMLGSMTPQTPVGVPAPDAGARASDTGVTLTAEEIRIGELMGVSKDDLAKQKAEHLKEVKAWTGIAA